MSGVSSIASLLVGLSLVGLAMVCAAVLYTDFTRRRIDNRLCAILAGLALVHLMASQGLSGISEIGSRGAVALLVAALLGVPFAVRWIGGGDVKLIMAMTLWVPLSQISLMFVVIVVTGALMAGCLLLLDRLFTFVRVHTVPYGAAIVVGGLFVTMPSFAALVRTSCTGSVL